MIKMFPVNFDGWRFEIWLDGLLVATSAVMESRKACEDAIRGIGWKGEIQC